MNATASIPMGRITLPLVQGTTELPIQLPSPTASLLDLLPSAWQAANLVTDDAIAEQTRAGKSISCKPHCGACCRQLVSISIPEAVRLADYVAEQPAERQQVLRDRFAAIVQKLEEVGMLDASEPATGRALIPPKGVQDEFAADALAIQYFQLQMPCPFLEDESCGIYEIRPAICREYHVTSPAELCQRVYDAPIERVVPRFRTGVALMNTAEQIAGVIKGHVPLSLSLEWASGLEQAMKQPRDAQLLANTFQQVTADQRERLDRNENVSAPTTNVTGESTATIDLKIGGRQLRFKVTVPNGPTSPRHLIPLTLALADLGAEQGGAAAKSEGETVSCKQGCAACCRQLVPVSEPEARYLADLVDKMPEPRRTIIRERFESGLKTLVERGILASLREIAPWPDGTRHRLAEEYFAAQIACPFLENEACSIYADRPSICREYLVTSPASACSDPFHQPIKPVPLPLRSPYRSLARAASGLTANDPVPWVPFILALEWSDANPEPAPARTGPALLRSIFENLSDSSAQ